MSVFTYHRGLIKENIIAKLQKVYSLPRSDRVGNKLPALILKNLFARAAKYLLKGPSKTYSSPSQSKEKIIN